MGQVKRVEEQHVSDALACVDQIVTEIHDAQMKIRAQALQVGVQSEGLGAVMMV
jgi:hypothetical protein